MKKNKALYMWSAVAAVAVAAAVFDYQWEKRQDELKSEAGRLLKMESSQIIAFELTGASYSVQQDGAPLMTNKTRFEKTGEGWWIKAPIDERADQDAVQGFVEGLVQERGREVPLTDAGVDWSPFGLNEPLGSVQVFDTTGASVQLSVGARKNFQGDPYLKRNDEPKVYLGTNSWLTRIEKGLRDFRDKRILREPSMKLKSATFREGDKSLTFELKETSWVSPEHPDWKLDQAKVREVLAALVGPIITEFKKEGAPTDAERQTAGFSPAALHIEAQVEGLTEPWTADISKAEAQTHQILMSHPVLWVAGNQSEVGRFFGLNALDFRDLKSPVEFDLGRVARVEVLRGQDFVRAQKKDDTWVVIEKSKADLDITADNVSRLMNGLFELRAVEFLPSRPSPKPDARTEIKLINDQGETVLALILANVVKKSGDQGVLISAQSNLSKEAFTLEQDQVQALGITPLLPKDLRPAPTPTPAATATAPTGGQQ